MQRLGSIVQTFLWYNQDWQVVLIFSFQDLEVSSFIVKGCSDHKPDCICTEDSVSLFLPTLKHAYLEWERKEKDTVYQRASQK